MPHTRPYLCTTLQEEYAQYLRHWPTITETQRRQEYVGPLSRAPRLSIITPVYHPDPLHFRAAIQSVLGQHYRHWELFLIFDSPQAPAVEHIARDAATFDDRITLINLPEHGGISTATNTGVQAAKGDYVGFLDHDDLLEPTALGIIAAHIACATYAPDLLYTDHDKIDGEGRRYDPEFKPDWSPETLLSHCYIGHCKVIRKSTFLRIGGFRREYDGAQDYDFFLRLAEETPTVVHIPHILYHWRSSPASTAASASVKSPSIDQGMRALQETLTRRRRRGCALRPPFSHQFNIGVYGLQFNKEDFLERVTVIIPTKDRPDLLEPCLRSIRMHTTYPQYEILVVNNGKSSRRLDQFLKETGVRRIDLPTEEFNFSHLLNRSLEHVQTPFVLFLNDDTEVLSRDWLLQMLGTITLDDHIGAVGAKFLYPDGRTQHSGVLLGLNDVTAGHANRHLPADDSGYRNSNRALRNYAAVTAACMLTRTALFRDVGGFDEGHFPIAYNDVDYCLKLLARGYRTVVQPDALLLHHQAASRGSSFHPDAEYTSRIHLRRVWGPILRADPYYNPNLSRHNEHFPIRSNPLGKHILFVSHNLAYEGASLSLLDLAIALKWRGYHIEVVSPHSGPLADIYAQHAIPTHTGTPTIPHPLLHLNRDTFDILFLNTITTAPLLGNEDIAAHVSVLCIRESERDYYTKELSGFSPALFSKASRIVFVADATRRVYEDCDRGHFTTIHTGMDCTRIDAVSQMMDRIAVRQSLGVTPQDTVITTIGTICPRKGQQGILEAAILLLPSFPRLHFLFIGGGAGSTYEKELRRRLRQSSFREHIHIINTTPDVDRYYRAGDIFACNSSIESFPRVILEAMAWKLPIVATDVFGIPEQVRSEKEALLVPPENPEALTHALRRLLENPTLRSTLAHNARKRVEECFDIDRMVERYEELFQELCVRPSCMRNRR